MQNHFLFTKEDMKNGTHFPVIAFFNIISSNDRFPDIVEMLSNGKGCGCEFTCCLFPNDVEVTAERFDGVEFSIQNGEEVILSYTDFFDYLEIACIRYIMRYPQTKTELESLLEKAKQSLQL